MVMLYKPLNNGIFATCECSLEMNIPIKDLENKAKTLYSAKLSSINAKSLFSPQKSDLLEKGPLTMVMEP